MATLPVVLLFAALAFFPSAMSQSCSASRVRQVTDRTVNCIKNNSESYIRTMIGPNRIRFRDTK